MNRWNGILESAIIGKVIIALTDEGYEVRLTNAGPNLYLRAVDKTEGREGWVNLVYGNGAYVISDYSLNLETSIKDVTKFASNWE